VHVTVAAFELALGDTGDTALRPAQGPALELALGDTGGYKGVQPSGGDWVASESGESGEGISGVDDGNGPWSG
jgi:hypothetical protein